MTSITDPFTAYVEVVKSGTNTPTQVSVTMSVVHRCPFKDEVDEGVAVITWAAHATTLELHSLRLALDAMDEWEVSHEEFTTYLATGIEALGFGGVSVLTKWNTAGMDVEVYRP